MMSKQESLTALLDLLEKLEAASIHYDISAPTPRTIMVNIAVPGERWEVEFHEDGEVEVEVFRSLGVEEGSQRMKELFERFSD
jgi:hypothetical protein